MSADRVEIFSECYCDFCFDIGEGIQVDECSFSDPLMSDAFSFHFSQTHACIKVSGEDAFDYLQSQFSNDLRASKEQPVTYGLFLSRKGKVVADAFILQVDAETFWLLSYFCPASLLLEKLEENIIADDVELEDRSSEFVLLSAWGACLPESAQQMGFAMPEAGQFVEQGGGYAFAGRRVVGVPAIELLVPAAQRALLEMGCQGMVASGAAIELDADAVDTIRIQSAIPRIPVDIGPEDLPQEGSLEDSAVSFTKGCYLGQEVMARLHAMGNVQRALVRVKLSRLPEALPQTLYIGSKAVGELRSVSSEETSIEGLALLKKRYILDTKRLAFHPDGEEVVACY